MFVVPRPLASLGSCWQRRTRAENGDIDGDSRVEIELGAAEGPVATTRKEAKFWITESNDGGDVVEVLVRTSLL